MCHVADLEQTSFPSRRASNRNEPRGSVATDPIIMTGNVSLGEFVRQAALMDSSMHCLHRRRHAAIVVTSTIGDLSLLKDQDRGS